MLIGFDVLALLIEETDIDSPRYYYSATAFHISGFMDSLPSCHHHLLTRTTPDFDLKVNFVWWDS
jgi:hypothetical protein